MADDYLGPRTDTRTGGRAATSAVLAGDFALSIGKPDRPPPLGWTWTPLLSLADLQTGHTPSRKRDEYWGGNIPWIGIKDATQNNGRTIYETVECTNPLGIANSSARVLPAQTVCLSRTASVGYVVIMGRPMATSQDFVNWVCGDGLNPLFLKYVLLAENRALHMYASGTTHQTIYFPEAKAFHICAPSRSEQDGIVELLDALDAKIEHNRRTTATLEETARVMFQSWFVDFDPVHAKAEGRDPGLPADIAALFPDSFGDDGLPEGWAMDKLGALFDIVAGNTPSTFNEGFWGAPHAWATPKDMSSLRSPILDQTSRQLTGAGLAAASSGLVPAGSLLLSSRAPIGYLAFAAMPLAINQGIAAFVKKEISTVYAWAWCQAHMDVIKSGANGSTFQEISKGTLRQLPMLRPTPEATQRFDEITSSHYKRIVQISCEIEALTQIRDFLLPKLISGEQRIPAAAHEVAAA